MMFDIMRARYHFSHFLAYYLLVKTNGAANGSLTLQYTLKKMQKGQHQIAKDQHKKKYRRENL